MLQEGEPVSLSFRGCCLGCMTQANPGMVKMVREAPSLSSE